MNSWMAILAGAFTAKKPVSSTAASYAKNSSKPCTVYGCGMPRHFSKGGRCFATRCTEHYLLQQAEYRARYKCRDVLE